jgi:hypothetical protein
MGTYIRSRHPLAKPTMCVVLMIKFGKVEKKRIIRFQQFSEQKQDMSYTQRFKDPRNFDA